MATIFIEGFDKYGAANEATELVRPLLAMGGWTLANPINDNQAYFIIPGLAGFGGGALQLGPTVTPSSNSLVRAMPGNYTRLIGGCRVQSDNGASMGIMFFDVSQCQCFIKIANTTGNIGMFQGNVGSGIDAATQIAISTAAVAGGTSHMLEWDISFGNPGTFTIYLDGVQILTGSGQLIQTANSYANNFMLFNQGGGGGGTYIGSLVAFDDIYMFDQTTAHNNAVLLSNSVVLTDFPFADHQKQFTNNGNVIGNGITASTDLQHPFNFQGFNFTDSANSLFLMPVTPNVNCTINSIGVALAEAGSPYPNAKFKGVIYSDSGGSPANLLSSGSEVTTTQIGIVLTLPLVSPQALTAGTQYWIGCINDTSVLLQTSDATAPWFGGGGGTSLTFNGRIAANTYTLGAPSTAPAMTAGKNSCSIFGNCTGASTNWESEALTPPLGANSSVKSSTPGNEDLYQYPGLPTTITNVYTVCVSACAYVSSPGSRTFDLVALSSGTSGNGNFINISPTTMQAWYDSYFETDPHTGSTWSTTAVTNGFYGMELVS
jgi:hypothetical protein